MKAIYKLSITEQLVSEIHKSKNLNKDIDYFVLTREEWNKLSEEMSLHKVVNYGDIVHLDFEFMEQFFRVEITLVP